MALVNTFENLGVQDTAVPDAMSKDANIFSKMESQRLGQFEGIYRSSQRRTLSGEQRIQGTRVAVNVAYLRVRAGGPWETNCVLD